MHCQTAQVPFESMGTFPPSYLIVDIETVPDVVQWASPETPLGSRHGNAASAASAAAALHLSGLPARGLTKSYGVRKSILGANS